MPASSKYFVVRTLSAVATLVVVMVLLSGIFISMADEQLETTVRETVSQEVEQYGADMTEEELENFRERREEELRSHYGLDDPAWRRVMSNAYNALTLNFGTSYMMDIGGSNYVIDIIMHRLPRTILLFTTAAVIYVILGIIIGLKAAQVAGGKLDKFLSFFGISASSMPMWWVGMIVILIFSYELGWFPSRATPFPDAEGLEFYLGVLHRMALPLGTIVFVLFGARAWATRNILTDVLQDDYIMAARAKGVPESKVMYGHALKTAAPPVVTSALLALLMSVGGAMITEVVFRWPGMGMLLYDAIMMNDVPVMTGVVFITTFLYIFGYLVADLLYGVFDPRVELGSGGPK